MTRFHAPDGTGLVWTEIGEGRPLLLLHGLASSAQLNWVRYGTAAELAAAGHRVIMPDLRGHGGSDKPHAPASWPADILASDAEALISHLNLADFDLGGYSLGARTAVRLLARGVRPARVVLAGMGLTGITDTGARSHFFLSVLANPGGFKAGTAEYMADAFMRQTGVDREALIQLLGAQVDTPESVLARLEIRALVLCGEADQDNGSSRALALALPNAAHVTIPGNHMSAVTRPELGTAMAAWLSH
jgi:pimeloyl-ACP methyl ester carboxylesterase